ncbi:DUF4363 family protein [Natronospora cellulosivora (SeqCode)]
MRIIAVILLIIFIFTLAIYGYNKLSAYAEDIYILLNDLENNIKNDNWDMANIHKEKLKEKWDESQKRIALMIDHTDFHDLNIVMTEIYFLIEQRERDKVLREITIAKELTQQLAEQAKPILENIF